MIEKKVSVIIPTGNEEYLSSCIDSIRKYTNMTEVEVIVVAQDIDNYLFDLDIKVVYFDRLIGYTKAINEGLKLANGEYIILLNDDTILLEQQQNKWIDLLVEPLKNKEVGLTGPVKFQWDCGGIIRTAMAFWCVAFRKDLINEIGMLDEVFSPGMGEDGDFSIKAEILGYKLIQVPTDNVKEFGAGTDRDFPIFHKGNGSFSDYPGKNEIIERNKKILEDRYACRLEKIYDFCYNQRKDVDTSSLFPKFRKYAKQCSHVTEMGVRGVFSTYAFLSAKPTKMVGYDIKRCPENVDEAIDVAKESNIEFEFIEQDVLEANMEETDLLFLDTLHTYTQASQELKLHATKVRKYILIHDTNTWGYKDEIEQNSQKQGLRLAIDEFLAQNKNWRICEEDTESNGLTVLERNPDFSIIVPTNNRHSEFLVSCLESLYAHTEFSNKEIIVVANGCSDDTLKYLDSQRRKIRYTWFGEQAGYVIPVNKGVELARSNYVILFDDDCKLLAQEKDRWVKLLFEPFLRHSNVGLSGPFAADYPGLGMILHSGCAMYSKEVWNLVKGFDRVFGFGYLSDADISLRIKKAGFEVIPVCFPKRDFPIYHPDSPTSTESKTKRIDLMRKNRNLLYERNGDRPMVSIIVPTFNHLEDCLKPCLDSVKAQTDLSQVEVIVVANGCTDGTAQYVDSLGHPFKLVWFDKPMGFPKSINAGIKASQGEYILILNNDTVLLDKGQPFNTWIDWLLQPMLRDEKVGLTGPLMLHDRYADYKILIFFCTLIRKKVFEEIGLLDESYSPGGGEDIDFCIRAEQAGWKQVQVPTDELKFTFTNEGAFPIYHAGEGTFSDKEMPEYGRKIIKDNGMKNMIKYNKHIKLNLGSGGVEVPGYISIDKFDYRANIVMDVFELDKHFPENSVEEILASHLFEHVNPYKSVDLLVKWCKILKPGGKLIMELPNIEELCKDFIAGTKQERYGILNCIYGAVNTTDKGEKGDITAPHLWGWYPEMMGDHLIWAGFTNIVFMPEQIPHPHKNFRVEACKPIRVKVKEEVLV